MSHQKFLRIHTRTGKKSDHKGIKCELEYWSPVFEMVNVACGEKALSPILQGLQNCYPGII